MSFFELQIKVEIFKLYSWIWLFHGRVDAAVYNRFSGNTTLTE